MQMTSGCLVFRAAFVTRNTFDRDDKLRDHWQNLIATFLQHLVNSHDGQKSVGVELFSQAVKEDRQIVMII